jgi:hypothetical protein
MSSKRKVVQDTSTSTTDSLSLISKKRGRTESSYHRPPPRIVEGLGEPIGVTFSANELKSSFVTLSRDRKSAGCSKGYRLLRATHGCNTGTWFCEFTISQDLKPGAQVRLGWASDAAFAHGPAGMDHHSYAYRGENGSRIHQSIRSPYGKPFKAGDVIGCLISFETDPAVIAEAEIRDCGASAGPADAVRQLQAIKARNAGKSRTEIEECLLNSDPPRRFLDEDGPPVAPKDPNANVWQRHWGSSMRFFVNGEDQGISFIHLTKSVQAQGGSSSGLTGRYFPAASLFYGASVRLNPGPVFSFTPTSLLNTKWRPVSELESVAGSALSSHGMAGSSMQVGGAVASLLPLALGGVAAPSLTLASSGSGGAAATNNTLSRANALLQLAKGGADAVVIAPYNFAGTSFAYTAAQQNPSFQRRSKKKDS